jgi:hypothetical protein
MRNLTKLTNAASTNQARHDYAWLLNLAAEHDLTDMIPAAGARPNHRAFDGAAKAGIAQLLAAKPELREMIAAVYPQFVKADKEVEC